MVVSEGPFDFDDHPYDRPMKTYTGLIIEEPRVPLSRAARSGSESVGVDSSDRSRSRFWKPGSDSSRRHR